jgi:hypothetical protein
MLTVLSVQGNIYSKFSKQRASSTAGIHSGIIIRLQLESVSHQSALAHRQ